MQSGDAKKGRLRRRSGDGTDLGASLYSYPAGTHPSTLAQYKVSSHYSVSSLVKKGKGSPYSITERRVPELIAVLGSQPAGDVSHKPGGRLPLLSARPAVTPATLKRSATNFAAWWTEAQWVWAVCLRLLPDRCDGCDLNPGLLRLSLAR